MTFLVSLPHFPTNVSWEHLPNKPLILKSLLQSLLIRGQEVSDSSTRSPIALVLSPLGGGGISQKPSGTPLTAYWSNWVTWAPSAVEKLGEQLWWKMEERAGLGHGA